MAGTRQLHVVVVGMVGPMVGPMVGMVGPMIAGAVVMHTLKPGQSSKRSSMIFGMLY